MSGCESPPDAELNVQLSHLTIADHDARTTPKSPPSTAQYAPIEILAEIFTISVLETRNEGRMSYKKLLLAVCLVCRQWRDAAYGYPILWSFLDIAIPVSPIGQIKTPKNKRNKGPKPLTHQRMVPQASVDARTWIERSRNRPVTCTIWAPTGRSACRCLTSDPSTQGRCPLQDRTLIDILLSAVTRLHSLAVTCPTLNCFCNLVQAVAGAATAAEAAHVGWPWNQVKELLIDASDASPDGDAPQPIEYPAFSHFASLTTLTLLLPSESPTVPTRPSIPPFILRQLRVLSIACDWVTPWISRLLQHCDNLEELTVDYHSPRRQGWTWGDGIPTPSELAPDGNITLPSLRVLRALNVLPIYAHRVLAFLRVPSLLNLHVQFIANYQAEDSEDEDTDISMPLIWEFLRSCAIPSNPSSHSTLRSLVIDQASWNEEHHPCRYMTDLSLYELDQLSMMLPSLSHFSLTWDALLDDDDPFVDAKYSPQGLPVEERIPHRRCVEGLWDTPTWWQAYDCQFERRFEIRDGKWENLGEKNLCLSRVHGIVEEDLWR